MEKSVQRVAVGVFFLWVAVAYFFLAAYWDDYSNEYLVYNYHWNFPLLDVLVWRVAPLLLTGGCFLLSRKVLRRR